MNILQDRPRLGTGNMGTMGNMGEGSTTQGTEGATFTPSNLVSPSSQTSDGGPSPDSTVSNPSILSRLGTDTTGTGGPPPVGGDGATTTTTAGLNRSKDYLKQQEELDKQQEELTFASNVQKKWHDLMMSIIGNIR